MNIKIALISVGLGNVSRGFETSTATWFNEIKKSKELTVNLYTGGKYDNAVSVWNLPRNGRIASFLRRCKLIHDGCKLEQITFSMAFLFHIILYRPDVIWLQEGILGKMLLFFRRLFGFHYKIIFCDGAPVGYQFAMQFDYIILLHEYAYRDAIENGMDPKRFSVIPHVTRWPATIMQKESARQMLNIPLDKFVIICVAAWNNHHKRIDYFLQETALLDPAQITLLLCGQPDPGYQHLQREAQQLGLDAHWHTFTNDQLSVAYAAADIFVLPSITEGLPAVIIEAAMHKLPVICHPHDGGKFILGESYPGLTDLTIKGTLAKKIAEVKASLFQKEGLRTAEIISKKFDPSLLVRKFVSLIEHVASN